MYPCLIVSNLTAPHRRGKIMSIDRCNHVNTDDLHISLSCSVVVTLHDYITSLVVFVICISILELATSEPHIDTVKIMGV